MATETRHIATCDRCGAEERIDDPDDLPETWTYVELDAETTSDLCSSCTDDLERFLATAPGVEQEPAPF